MQIPVGKASDLAPGSLVAVAAGATDVVVLKTEQGEIYALEDRCSHADVALSGGTVEDCAIECPAHGARFDAATGRALCLPAVKPVRVFEVAVVDDTIFVIIPD